MNDDSFRNKPLFDALGINVGAASSGNLDLNWGLPIVYTFLDLTGEAVCVGRCRQNQRFRLGSLATRTCSASRSTWQCASPMPNRGEWKAMRILRPKRGITAIERPACAPTAYSFPCSGIPSTRSAKVHRAIVHIALSLPLRPPSQHLASVRSWASKHVPG
jgi:hypothetical protein